MENIVLTKHQADKAIRDSIFNIGGTLACLPKIPLDGGKYAKSIIGKPHAQGCIVWAERRVDHDGPYWKLYTLDV